MVPCFVMPGALPFPERVKYSMLVPPVLLQLRKGFSNWASESQRMGGRFPGSGSKRLFRQYCRYRHRGCNVSVNDAEGDMMRRSFVNTQHGSETQHSAAGILDSVPSSLRRAIRR